MLTTMRGFLIIAALLLSLSTSAETVDVKYRGPVDLKPFACESIQRSSLVTRLCYDRREKYVIVQLARGTYYHYCGVPSGVVSEWRQADSMGKFFNANINGRFDCRVTSPPNYR